MNKHTPGPWRWELNLKGKSIQLCGGKPQYDLTVMDFTRWGMNGARPRVLDFSDMMLLREAEEFRVFIPGREHHASWFQGINHPDMNLIAAAPELYDAGGEMAEAVALLPADDGRILGLLPILCRLRAAIAKAEGN